MTFNIKMLICAAEPRHTFLCNLLSVGGFVETPASSKSWSCFLRSPEKERMGPLAEAQR